MNKLNEIGYSVAKYRKHLLVACAGMALVGASPLVRGQAATTQANPPAKSSTNPGANPTTNPPANPSTLPSQAPDQDQKTATIKVLANEVDLVFTVTDKNGKFITGLHSEDFGLLDDGRNPEQVFHFQQQTSLPLRVGIMLDTSSSIRQRFQFEQDSAITFLLQVLHRNDRAFAEGFDVQMDVEQGFTNNIDLLNQGIHKLRPGGGTALYDALYSTCKDQMLTLRETGPVRKAIVLVSDGVDNYSHALEEDAIKECQRADTIVYAISTDISPTKDKQGVDALHKIAETTGGRAFFPVKIEDVALDFNSIEEELRSQYLLEYRPANFKQDGSFRTIYLQAHDPRYHVRAHTGYFAPKAAE
ncbi:MAG TPA: VWA domain-containing protein [Acidobacteriaceae bacterium]|nr:VWA domain-containing protein [Acidobacteriaceae bacterium]